MVSLVLDYCCVLVINTSETLFDLVCIWLWLSNECGWVMNVSSRVCFLFEALFRNECLYRFVLKTHDSRVGWWSWMRWSCFLNIILYKLFLSPLSSTSFSVKLFPSPLSSTSFSVKLFPSLPYLLFLSSLT